MVTAATRANSIDLRLLGPLVAVVDGAVVALGGPRQKGVLARLALSRGQVVSMSQLVASVWDGDEPARPEVAVRSYVSNLRRAIEPHRRRRSAESCIVSSGAGYMLDVEPEAIDHIRFDSFVRSGRRDLSANEPASAIVALRDALSLWRGEPCTGLSTSETFTAYRSQFEQVRQMALELLFEAQLARGDHLSVVAAVEGAIAESPLRERLTELAMVAFYRAGRQSDALGFGRRLRSRLRDELGVDPSPDVSELEIKILNHDKSLSATSIAGPVRSGAALSSGQPRTIDGVSQSGVSQSGVSQSGVSQSGISQRSAPGLASIDEDEPTASMLSSAYLDASEGSVEVDMSTTADLPLQRRSDSNIVAARPVIATVGRSTELEAMSSVLAEVLDRRSIAAVITGEPGIGKTRLVETMTETAEANGVAVAWARCVEGEQDAMWPWSQLILDLLDNELVGRPSSERWTGLEPLRALGPSVVAALGLPPISEVASSSAFEQPKSGDLLLAMTLLLHHVARTTPLTLVFDDVHWADPQTIRMLRFAARSLANLPIAFVVTWSLHEIRDGATVASELRSLSRLPSLVRVDLEGLDTGAVQQLAEKSGHRFSVCQADDLRQRSAGNPLYALELLNAVGADGALESVEIGQCPKLVDAVINRVDFVDLRARRLLSVASLFRTSFSASQLATVCGFTVRDTEDILNATVRGALVDEVDSACGQYRFRCPLVAEVVQDGLLAGERIGFHRAIGQHLLSLEGPSYEVAYHLVAGRRREDQILAAEIALEIFEQRPDYGSVVDVDPIVEQLLVAERSGGEPDLPPKLDIAVHLYLSWRAWLDRRCEDWATANSRALRGALELFSKDGVGDGSPADSAALARLARSATARVGVPVYYPGPVAEPYVEQATANDVAVLEGVSAALPVDQPSHWVVEIQLAHLRERDTKPTAAATMRGVREAKQALKKAEEKIDSDHIPVVRSMLLNRFGDRLSSEEQLQIVDHLRSTERSLVCDLFATRWAYPALMALGRRAEADERIQSAWNRARTTGDQVQVAEARAVRITHLLWTGQLDEAESQILRGIADWRKIGGRGLAAFGNQLYQVRRMKGDDVDPGGKIVKQLPRREHSLRPVRTAMVLADTGYHDRAFEHLDSAVEAISGRITPTADLAELAMAAALLDHADAGRLACTRLAGRSNRLLTNDTQGGSDVPGDRLIVSVDRFSVFGPASYFAGLGAAASGQRARATELIAAAVGLVKTSGGSLCGMRNLLSPFRDRLDFSEIGLDQ